MITHIKPFAAGFKNFDQFRMPVAKIVGATIEVQVNQALAIHVIKVITFAPVNDKVDPHILPVLGFARIPEIF